MKNRIIAAMLACAMLFSLASCKKGEEIPPKDKNLVIQTEEVVYTDEDNERFSLEIAELFVEAMPVLGYPAINEDKKAEIANGFCTKIIPVLREIPIYREELDELIEGAREVIRGYDETDGDSISLFVLLYVRFSSIVDFDRLGALAFELQAMRLDGKLSEAQTRYDKYGYSYLREDVERYGALVSISNSMDADTFSDALSVFVFMLSAVVGQVGTDGVFSVKTGDVLMILRKQGERFSSIDLTAEEWQCVTYLLEEFIPDKTSSDLEGKMLWALEEDDFFPQAALIMPELIDFYAKVVSDISKENADLISTGEEYAIPSAICREILRREDDLRALLLRAEEVVPKPGETSLNTVKTYASADYGAFVESYSANIDELIDVISLFATTPSEDNYTSLMNTVMSYTATLNSVIAYVYLYA